MKCGGRGKRERKGTAAKTSIIRRRADEKERHAELEQQPVHQHDVAHGHGAGHHVVRRQPHDRAQAAREDRVLAHVEHGEAGLRLERGALVAAERVVVGGRLVGLVVEVPARERKKKKRRQRLEKNGASTTWRLCVLCVLFSIKICGKGPGKVPPHFFRF